MGLGALKATLTRPAEALGRAPVSLHLRHFRVLQIFEPCTYALMNAAEGGY